MENPLLLTHNDTDGSGCAIMVVSLYPEAPYEFHDYNSIDDRLNEIIQMGIPDECDGLIMADIASNDQELTEKAAMSVITDGFPVHFYDHHEGREYFNEMEGCRHDKEACGTLILAEELGVDDDHMAFAKLVDVWDRFLEDDPDFEHAWHSTLLHNFIGQDEFVGRGPELDFDEVDDYIVQRCVAQHDKDVQRAQEGQLRFRDSEGNLFCFVIGITAQVAHELYADDDLDYVMSWRPESGTVSLYSKEGKADVSEIAKSRGGGGHVHASGYPTDAAILKKLTALLTHVKGQ
jgi:oligoribonuclease NrnB/cAMP/cGMP phosphodiesterase (DHH superfamily)